MFVVPPIVCVIHDRHLAKDPQRASQIGADCSTSQQRVGFVLSKADPDHHIFEARLDALYGVLLRCNMIRCDDYHRKLVML